MFHFKQYEIYSEKYQTRGIITQILDKTGIQFLYDKTYYHKRIEEDCSHLEEDAIKALCLKEMEEYLVQILAGEVEAEKVRLYNWYLEKGEKNGIEYLRAHGNVTGHYRFEDSLYIHTSKVESIDVDEENGTAVICTHNTRYFCPLDSWKFEEQDNYTDAVPDYLKWKEKYEVKETDAPIEDGKILLSISNYDTYYFHGLYYKPKGADEAVKYSAMPHVGTFQDSFLIQSIRDKIDLRYFPHSGNIEFYEERTNNSPWFIENVGTAVLYARTSVGNIKLQPGERKEVKEENAEKGHVRLEGGDLYPAAFIE